MGLGTMDTAADAAVIAGAQTQPLDCGARSPVADVKRGSMLMRKSTTPHVARRGIPRRPRLSGLLLVLALASGAVALFVTPALAAQVRTQISTFDGSGSDAGAFGTLARVAIHQATGTVYAIDASSSVVDKFDASGAAQDFSALSTSSLDGSHVTGPDGPVTFGLAADSDLAVDNSGTATDGRLYVLEESGATAFAFNADGTYIRKITLPGADTCGIAVDSGGHVWISDYNSSSVIEYDASGVATGTTIDTSAWGSPCHSAFDSNDNLYVALFGGLLLKYDSSGAFQNVIDFDGTSAVAVDPATDHVFAVHSDHVSEYDSAGAPVLTFGQTDLSFATGIAVRGSTGQAYVSDAADRTVHVFGMASTLVTVATGAATAPATSSVTLNGTVDPEGTAVTDCHFAYGATIAYGQSVPCAETAGDIGTGTGPVSVHADVSGLEASSDYHFKLVAANASGVSNGDDAAFSTEGRPTVTGSSISHLTSSAATFTAQVNPRGSSTTYHVDYVDDAHFQTGGFANAATVQTPESAPIGSDLTVHDVSQTLTGLDASTKYHVRVVATNAVQATNGSDRPFVTLANVSTASGLPNGRAYEMVSPADKGPVAYAGDFIDNEVHYQVTPDGNQLVYPLSLGLPGATAGGPVRYRADRGASSWVSSQLTPPALIPVRDNANGDKSPQTGTYQLFSPDLSCGVVMSIEPLTADAPASMVAAGNANLFRRNADGSYTALTNQAPSDPDATGGIFPYTVEGAASDCSRVVFSSRYHYPGVGASGLYEWSAGSLHNVAVLPDGTVAGGASAGYQDDNGGSTWNAVSTDGTRVFFSATSNAGGDSGTTALFLRENGQSTVDVSQSETGTITRGAAYQLASKTGDHVLFLANYGLTSTSSAGPTTADCTQATKTACDLYDYDVQSGDLTNLSADANPADANGATVAGVLGASDDASSVYFAAQGQLVTEQGNTYAANAAEQTYNIYRAHGTTTTFVGVLNKSDLGNDRFTTQNASGALISGAGFGEWRSRVTPDGRHLLFSSSANVVGYDSGGVAEAYRYSADSGLTVCISCRSDGEPSVGNPATADGATAPLEESAGLTRSPLAPPRTLTDDGKRVFFTMPDVLAPGAVQGAVNVYQWEDGAVSLLASGPTFVSPINQGLRFVGASASGDDVFIRTNLQLAPFDTDLRADIYDIRVGGGLPAPPPPVVPCDSLTDKCQGSGSQSTPRSLTTLSPGAEGNAQSAPRGTLSVRPLTAAQRASLAAGKTVTATATVNVPGTVKLAGTSTIKKKKTTVLSAKATAVKTGSVTLKIKLSSTARRELVRTHKLTVALSVSFSKAADRVTQTLKLTHSTRRATVSVGVNRKAR